MSEQDQRYATPGGDDPTLDEKSIGGLGEQLDTPIVSLPPIEPMVGDYPLSKRTGEPVRKPLIAVSMMLFLLSAIVAHASYWWFWWEAINITNFSTSARLITWLDPRPGSWQSIVIVVVLAIMGIIMTALPGAAAYAVWQGLSYTKWMAIAAVVSGLLAIFFFNWAFLALILSAVAAVVVWLPATRSYFAAWHEIHHPEPVEIIPTIDVKYGPAPRFQ